MKMAVYKFLAFADDLLEIVLLGAWKKGRKWPFTTLALLLLACLSLIFLAGPCSSTSGPPPANACFSDHELLGELCNLIEGDLSRVSSDEVINNELDILLSSGTDDEGNVEIAGLAQFFYKRPFLDKLPRDQHDKYNVFFFTDKSVGAYVEVEYMKQINEFFLFKKVLNRFAYVFPYSKLKGMTRFKLESCDGPGTFDLKLTIFNDPKNNKQKRVFYSWKSFKPPVSN